MQSSKWNQLVFNRSLNSIVGINRKCRQRNRWREGQNFPRRFDFPSPWVFKDVKPSWLQDILQRLSQAVCQTSWLFSLVHHMLPLGITRWKIVNPMWFINWILDVIGHFPWGFSGPILQFLYWVRSDVSLYKAPQAARYQSISDLTHPPDPYVGR